MRHEITQLQWIEAHLREHEEISRNFCLRNYITRLAKYVGVLKKRGWEFNTEKRPTNSPYSWAGYDYVYIATTIPPERKMKR